MVYSALRLIEMLLALPATVLWATLASDTAGSILSMGNQPDYGFSRVPSFWPYLVLGGLGLGCGWALLLAPSLSSWTRRRRLLVGSGVAVGLAFAMWHTVTAGINMNMFAAIVFGLPVIPGIHMFVRALVCQQ